MSQIDPSKAVPQAPRALRAGSKGFARRQKAAMAGAPVPAAMDDDDDDDDEDEDPESSERDGAKAIADHEPIRAAAEQAHLDAAAAYASSKGTDSAAALMHAEDMGDAAGEAHGAAKASSMTLRGAAPENAAPVPAPPGAHPPAAIARAVVAVAGPSADAQLELTRDAALGKKMRALFGGATHDETEGLARAAHADAADAKQLRAAAAKVEKTRRTLDAKAAETALRAEVSAAVRAGKYTRAELADVTETVGEGGQPVEAWTPKAWLREMAPAARAAMIAAKQARASSAGTLPDETPVAISSTVLEYGRRRGWPPNDPRYAALAAQLSTTTSATAAPQETA